MLLLYIVFLVILYGAVLPAIYFCERRGCWPVVQNFVPGSATLIWLYVVGQTGGLDGLGRTRELYIVAVVVIITTYSQALLCRWIQGRKGPTRAVIIGGFCTLPLVVSALIAYALS